MKRYDIGGCMTWVLFERARISCIVHDEMALLALKGLHTFCPGAVYQHIGGWGEKMNVQ